MVIDAFGIAVCRVPLLGAMSARTDIVTYDRIGPETPGIVNFES